MNNLIPPHRIQLENYSAILPEVIEARGYKSVSAKEAKDYGFSGRQAKNGLLFPIYPPDGTNSVYQLRPDNPRKSSRGKVIKYEWKAGASLRLDIPPMCHKFIGDTSKDVIFTEGAKKADSLVSHLSDYLIINLPGGVYGWRNVKGVLPDFDVITWQDRRTYILFDSDVMTKKEVKTAMVKLSAELKQRGAKVSPVYLPSLEDGKTGIDDFFAAGHTVDELLLLMKSAELLPVEVGKTELPTTEDYINALSNLGYSFRLNLLDDSVEVNSESITDSLAAKIRAQMRDLDFNYVNVMQDAYLAHAYDNRYHPLVEYLNSLQWNGQPNIDNLLTHFQDSDSDDKRKCPTFSIWLRRWLIGACAKVLEQGQNAMLVLDGPQNLGKSYFVRWLCPLEKYFIESPINPDDKDSSLRLIRSFVWEVSELGATTRRADVEALKFFITQKVVTVRKPYGHFDIKKPAMASLIGTLNNSVGFLNDPTGSRRFLTVTLTGINWAYSKMDVNQVWAEAMHLYRSGERWELSREEQQLRDSINQEYEVENPTQNWLDAFFDIDANSPVFTPTADIVKALQELGIKAPTRIIQMDLAATLKKMGFKSQKVYSNGKQQWGYYGITPIQTGNP